MVATAVPSALKPPKIATSYSFASLIAPVDGSIVAGAPYQAIYCGGSGDLKVTPVNSAATVTFKRVPAGTTIPLQVQGVESTGTTATDIIGLG